MKNNTDTTNATATPAAPAAPANTAATVTLEFPIARGATTITQLHLRKPKAGALRGINLAELLMLRAESVMVLLPRITEPPLLKHEVENMEPVDLIACATEVVNFLAPQATLDKAQEAQREAAYLTE